MALRLTTENTDTASVARWFGAMQSQDLASGLWSFGARLPHSSLADVEAAFARAEVLRTWPMRGTLHVVAAEDARWMLELTGRRALRTTGARWQYLGLDQETATRATELMAQMLVGRRMRRPDVLARLSAQGIDCSGQRGYHLLWYAAQTGVTCVGPEEGSQPTYVLLEEWAPVQRDLSGEAALAELATRYFRSHGPTTRQDFAGWSGLSAAEAKQGIAAAGDVLLRGVHEGRDVWMSSELPDEGERVRAGGDGRRLLMLAGFDEFLLGYKDRSLSVPDAHRDRIVPGNNGVFQPTIVRDGRVLGTWRRAVRSRRVQIRVMPFEPLSATARKGVQRAADRYAAFLGLESDVRWA